MSNETEWDESSTKGGGESVSAVKRISHFFLSRISKCVTITITIDCFVFNASELID